MLTYNVEERGRIPAYEYIYKCIKNDILTGQLRANEKLPSKRRLADNLKVSVITIQNSYEQLLYEGYIYAIEKKGYYVSELTGLMSVINGTENIIPEDTTDKGSCSDKILMDFTANHDSSQLFPYATWARLTRKALLDNEMNITKKPENTGVYRLRQAIARYLKEFRGLQVNPGNIVIGAGTEYLYSLILQLLGRTRMIAVEDPGHSKVHRIYESNGVKVLHVPIDDEGMIPDRLESGNIAAVHLSPTHHYPTGVITSAVRRHKILDIAGSKDFYVIEDDYDSEFHYEGKPIPTMASLNPERVIYMNTFSKTIMESLRIAYMVLPDELMKGYNEKLSFYSCTVSGLEQYTLAEFIEGGYFERHINRSRLRYKKSRNIFLHCFEKSGLSRISKLEENGAGLHFIIRHLGDKPVVHIKEELQAKGIIVKNVSSYCNRPDEKMDRCFIINYFEVDEELLTKAFGVMLSCFE